MTIEDLTDTTPNTHPLFVDITGLVFNRLTVIKYVGKRGRSYYWECRCECGNTCLVLSQHLKNGHTRSCGCLRESLVTQGTRLDHGMTGSYQYTIWQHIKGRCFNPNNKAYRNYGGRGITMCDRWQNFRHFAADIGERPTTKHSLDRADNNGHYEPANVRWATAEEQMANRRNTIRLTANGITKTIMEWADNNRTLRQRIVNRIVRGWCEDCSVLNPLGEVCIHKTGA